MQIRDFTTRRLSVTSWRSVLQSPQKRAALEQKLAVILTPNVLTPLPEPLWLPRGQGQIAEWVSARAAESDVYSVTDFGSGVLLGLLILAPGDAKTVHLGYMLAEAAWGSGYATEVVGGLLHALPEQQGITVVAGVEPRNPASSAVLLKSGFELSEDLSTPDIRFYTYEIV